MSENRRKGGIFSETSPKQRYTYGDYLTGMTHNAMSWLMEYWIVDEHQRTVDVYRLNAQKQDGKSESTLLRKDYRSVSLAILQ